jgi:hypothetical protein
MLPHKALPRHPPPIARYLAIAPADGHHYCPPDADDTARRLVQISIAVYDSQQV